MKKTISILIATLLVLIAPTAVMGVNPIESTKKSENMIEKIFKDEKGQYKKYIAIYNTSGAIEKKINYQWNRNNDSWVPTNKYEYSYNLGTKQVTMNYSKWNNEKHEWCDNCQTVTFDRKDEGTLALH